MQFLTPTFLALGLLAIPILLLYMLKLRRREVEVSSTMLWRQVLRDRQANSPWQRLRRNLLLFLQLLILTALVLALSRPALPVPALTTGPVAILLDASASMNAVDVEPSRFEAARKAVRGLIDELGSDSNVTLILVGAGPQVLISNARDKNEVRRALARARPEQGAVDWEAAFTLAAGIASSGTFEPTIVVVSDGGLPPEGMPPLPGEVKYVKVGQGDDNLAITALSLRPSDTGGELFAEVRNYGSEEQRAILSLDLDGELYHATRFEVPPGDGESLVLTDLPPTARVVHAMLEPTEGVAAPLDALSLDDEAYAVYQPGSDRRALLYPRQISPPKYNLFVEKVLLALSSVQPFRAVPDEEGGFEVPASGFDVYVLDGVVPDPMPNGNILFINPPENAFFTVLDGSVRPIEHVRVVEHPITRHIHWEDVHVLEARRINPPPWAEVLIDTPEGPLAFIGGIGGHRIAVITFDLFDSDLPLQIAFPIFFANLMDYLAPPLPFNPEARLTPGGVLTITPSFDIVDVSVSSPSGQTYFADPAEDGFTFTEINELGLYTVEYHGATTRPPDHFAVNLFEALESDLKPRDDLPIGARSIQSAGEREVGQRELWPWAAGIALTTLVVEWWVYHRRGSLTRWAEGDFLRRLGHRRIP